MRNATLWPCTLLLLTALLCTTKTVAADAHTLSLADARHLISRTGLGVTAEQLTTLTGKSRSDAINYIMDGFTKTPALPMPAWTREPAPLYWTRQDMQTQAQRQFDRRRDAELTELRQWWVDNMLATTSPQTERLVLFWHNHFATSYHGVNRQSKALAMQNATFRNHATGNFRALLKAMLRDPALLNYLDNLSNRKHAPNENLARELLELFTLGEGNYNESTVREAARALAGYGVSQNRNLSFELQSWNVDNTDKSLFGQTDNFNGDDLIDLILQQPSTAYHIAGKFWHAFVSDTPATKEQLDPLASAFINSDFNTASLYRAVLEHDAFWAAGTRASLVKSPVQLLVGLARALDYPKTLNQQLPSLLARSGMNLFAPPNVAGWPGGNSWITSGRLLNRYAAIEKLTRFQGTSADTLNQMQSMGGNAMLNMMSENSDSSNVKLELHIAAEDYNGPADFRVELLDHLKEPVWDSGKQALAGGHETTKFGRISDLDKLPWQVVSFPVTKNAINDAQSLRVHFLNDDGGQNGDRNLFVRGATIGSTWLDSASGTQQSKCPPRSTLDSGRLYCQGHVSLPIKTTVKETRDSSKHYVAASSHVTWVRAEQHQLDLTLTLQDFHANNKHYPTYSFHLHSANDSLPRIEVNTFGCWPDCVNHWPECSWFNDINPSRKVLAFPLERNTVNNVLQCHDQSLNATDRAIIHSLFSNAASLLEHARSSTREFSPQQTNALNRWANTLKLVQPQIQQQFTQGRQLTIDTNVQREEPPLQAAAQFQPIMSNAEEAAEYLAQAKLSFAELLLAGISSRQLPEFAALTSLPASDQLQFIFEHPVFQLH